MRPQRRAAVAAAATGAVWFCSDDSGTRFSPNFQIIELKQIHNFIQSIFDSPEFQSVSTFGPNRPVRDPTDISGDRNDVRARKLVRERKPPWIVSSGRRIRPFQGLRQPPLPPSSSGGGGDGDDASAAAGDGGAGDGEATANWPAIVPHSWRPDVRCPSASDLSTKRQFDIQ